jgi:aspartate/glutamate racemase
VFSPTPKEQQEIDILIFKILRWDLSDIEILYRVINRLQQNWVEAVFLACTDLQLVFNQKKVKIPIYDTMEISMKAKNKELNTYFTL